MMLVKSKTEQSKIHGIGLFADEFIAKGTKVWEYTPWFDFSLTKEQVKKLSEASKEQFLNYAYLSKETGKYVLCSDDARFFNHQKNPNVVCIVPKNSEFEEALECFAVQDIMKGEELTCDYSEFEADFLEV
ncbi:MAG: SET domain-containing protein [Candidatus Taylorbacteria bacterium]|nr:SET domain-containing protein [Candidatus Taylorbacteria bacterium]